MNRTKSLVQVALGAAFIAICAWLTIPGPVPFTMQTLAVLTVAGLLGMGKGCAAVGVYLLLGAVGVPVFSGFRGGVQALVGPTGGYLIGYVPYAIFSGLPLINWQQSFVRRCLLMLLGGSSSSTSGGIKTGTFAVLMLYTWARCRGKRTITVYNRRISNDQVLDAVTITGLMAGLAIFGGIFISVNSDVSIGQSIFTSISAIATCGLSMTDTAQLHLASQILIILFMFFGRVGILSISLSFLSADPAEERIQRAETKLIIG